MALGFKISSCSRLFLVFSLALLLPGCGLASERPASGGALGAGSGAGGAPAGPSPAAEKLKPREASASSASDGALAGGAIDGDRFSSEPGKLWKGGRGAGEWWWQATFDEPCAVGAILQIGGDHPSGLQNAALRYVWQASLDGEAWQDIEGTEVRGERRLFRVHRLARPLQAKHLRLKIRECVGEAPSLREVEFYLHPSAAIPFPDWVVSVGTTVENKTLPGEAEAFVKLARSCRGREDLLAQWLWLGDFDEAFCVAEPRPLCAFLTGNFLEWCQQEREPWRGVGEVLANRNLPIWAACGGAQGLAILQETGVDSPWDCPRCRDPERPKSPVYSHIGHTGEARCGDYSKCVAERGKFKVRLAARDPAFEGLPDVFEVMESHIGQIAYVPRGWVRVATRGPGALTENQCLRVADRYIYAAQFHMEMAGTPETSRKIMSNFLSLAKEWGGYSPGGKPVPAPEPLPEPR